MRLWRRAITIVTKPQPRYSYQPAQFAESSPKLMRYRNDRYRLYRITRKQTSMSPDVPKRSPVEKIKEASHFLAGSIPEEIASDSDHFNKDNLQLLKFHGSYQQDDRDRRIEAKKAGVGKYYSMMLRLRIPGGRISSDQFFVDARYCVKSWVTPR